MPELAEVKIMSEYINDVCYDRDFTSITLSPEVARRLPLDQPSDLQIFSISSKSRGKELLLGLGKDSTGNPLTISIAMGMSGNWIFCRRDKHPPHSHLHFNTIDGWSLCLVDARRFARWRWASWSSSRGPCPVSEKEEFRSNINSNLHKPFFKKPIHLALMDQTYFNGIGNYLRAEILFKAGQDPFELAGTAILNNPKILELCSTLPYEAYLIGGGQLKDWKNPFQVPSTGFSEWMKCYGKASESIVDRNGRKLWYCKSQLKPLYEGQTP